MAGSRSLLILIGAVCAASVALSSCSFRVSFNDDLIRGSGAMATKVFELGEFDSIHVSSIYDVDVEVGANPSVEVTADDNVMDVLEIRVRSSNLELGLVDDVSLEKAVVRATVTVPELKDLRVSGVADVSVKGVNATDLDVAISGAASVLVDLTVGDLSVKASGTTDVTGNGEALTLDLSSSGTSKLDFSKMKTTAANVAVSGTATVDVSQAARVSGAISGAATLRVNPESDVDVKSSGVATVRTG